jgi:hypothetical protein
MFWRDKSLRPYAYIGLLSLAAAAVNSLIFYPGFLSPDSLHQLSQASGKMPITDWHPPIMSAVWKVLIGLTGTYGSMLVLQIIMLWIALGVFAVCIYKITNSFRFSLALLAVGFLPYVLGISGVIWKDVQLCAVLLLAVSILLYRKVFKPGTVINNLSLVIVGLCLIYAILIRYNVAIALIPIFIFVLKDMNVRKRWVVGGSYVLAVTATMLCLQLVLKPVKTHPVTSVMLDDIVHVASANDLQSYTKNNKLLAQTLIEVQQKCSDGDVRFNSFIACTNAEQKTTISEREYKALFGIWMRTIVSQPAEYLAYRLEVFSNFLIVPKSHAFIWQNDVSPNTLNIGTEVGSLGRITKLYVVDFTYEHFSFVFQPWFWLLFGMAGMRYSRKAKGDIAKVGRVLFYSGVLYIVCYLPIAVALDYRYTYWSTISITVAWLLIFIGQNTVSQNADYRTPKRTTARKLTSQ